MILFGNISHTLGGKSLPATIYLLIALTYIVCGDINANIMVIRISYILYYLLSVYYFVVVHRMDNLPRYIKALDRFLILVLIYSFIDIILKGMQPIGTWGNLDFIWWHIKSIAPIYPFFYFGKKGMLSDRWFIIVFVLCFISTYMSFQTNIKRQLAIDVWQRTEFINNVGYTMVSLLPMVMLFSKNKLYQYCSIGLIVVFTLLSFKRGAMLCLALSLLFFLFKQISSKNKISNTTRVGILLLTLIGFYALYWFVAKLFETSDFFVTRMDITSEGGDSGRSEIYGYYYNTFIHSDLFYLIFGRGVLATRNVLQLSIEAHNDWLEYATDLGLVGIIFYLVYWKCFIKTYFYSQTSSDENVSMALGVIIIIYLVRTFFSMSFYDMPFCSSIVLGYCIAMANKKQFVSYKSY